MSRDDKDQARIADDDRDRAMEAREREDQGHVAERHDEEDDAAASERRGFAGMNEDKQREIASKGGRAAHEKGTAHEFTPDEARAAGKKGGERVSKDRAHMAAIGRKGGERVSKDRAHMAAIGRKGGEVVSGDRQHMANIGRKGGESRSEKTNLKKTG